MDYRVVACTPSWLKGIWGIDSRIPMTKRPRHIDAGERDLCQPKDHHVDRSAGAIAAGILMAGRVRRLGRMTAGGS